MLRRTRWDTTASPIVGASPLAPTPTPAPRATRLACSSRWTVSGRGRTWLACREPLGRPGVDSCDRRVNDPPEGAFRAKRSSRGAADRSALRMRDAQVAMISLVAELMAKRLSQGDGRFAAAPLLLAHCCFRVRLPEKGAVWPVRRVDRDTPQHGQLRGGGEPVDEMVPGRQPMHGPGRPLVRA
jgi:hypothetical protein